MQQKTILEWLQQAKADGHKWADEALSQKGIYNVQVKSLPDALEKGFNWSDSWEGQAYWAKIWYELVHVTK